MELWLSTLDHRPSTFYHNGMTQSHSAKPSSSGDERRSFFVKFCAVVCGAIVAVFPVGVGLGVVLDPYLRKKRRAAANSGEEESVRFLRICSLNALPADGVPRPFAVVSDVVDGWTHVTNQKIGMVFLEHTSANGKPNVVALNAKCPHLGCLVDFNQSSSEFECPCHKSAFAKDGGFLYGPSLRGLDPQAVEIRTTGGQQEVWVAFQNFMKGIAERTPAG